MQESTEAHACESDTAPCGAALTFENSVNGLLVGVSEEGGEKPK